LMGAGRGRGREKRREDWRRRAVGEDMDLDMADRERSQWLCCYVVDVIIPMALMDFKVHVAAKRRTSETPSLSC